MPASPRRHLLFLSVLLGAGLFLLLPSAPPPPVGPSLRVPSSLEADANEPPPVEVAPPELPSPAEAAPPELPSPAEAAPPELPSPAVIATPAPSPPADIATPPPSPPAARPHDIAPGRWPKGEPARALLAARAALAPAFAAARAAQPRGANHSLEELGVLDMLEAITATRPDGTSLALCKRCVYDALLAALRRLRCEVAACNGIRVLVFGSGHDSPMWGAANDGEGAVTVVVEENPEWVEFAAAQRTVAGAAPLGSSARGGSPPDVILARYSSDSGALNAPMAPPEDPSEAALSLRGHSPFEPGYVLEELMEKLAADYGNQPWDFVFVDGPLAHKHGRMSTWATAALLVAGGGVVAGHDVQRCIEAFWVRSFFPPHAADRAGLWCDWATVLHVKRPTVSSLAELVADLKQHSAPPSRDDIRLMSCGS